MREGLSRLGPILVLAFFGLPLFVGLGRTDLANDEAIYSYAVESVLTTGDWLSPRSSPNEGTPFLEKPPLKFWIVAAPVRFGLLPYNEFGLRFWDALFGALAFLYVFLIGRRFAGPVCGVFAGLVLFAHAPLLFDHGLRSNNMDAALVLAYTGGVYHFLRWGSAPDSRAAHIGAVSGWFFLGFMTKFVAALFLPMVLILSALVLPEFRRRLVQDWRVWAAAGAVTAALGLPWFLYQWSAQGEVFWRVMFGEHVYTRFTQFADPRHVQPWHFYVTEGFNHLRTAGSAIWVGLGLVMVLVHTIRRRTPEGVVILLWLALPLALISLGNSKLYHYFYPFLPPLALSAGAAVAWIIVAINRYQVPGLDWIPRLPSAIRAGAWIVAAVAVILAGATAILGAVRIDGLFRNSSVVRPLVAGMLALTAAGGLRAAAALGLVVLLVSTVPTPLAAYGDNLRRLTVTRRPLASLAECLRQVDASRSGAYAPISEAAFLHPYFYYLRGEGWHRRAEAARLRSALTVAGQERPVVLEHTDYARLGERHGPDGQPPGIIELPTGLVLLPGPFRVCGRAAGSSGR